VAFLAILKQKILPSLLYLNVICQKSSEVT